MAGEGPVDRSARNVVVPIAIAVAALAAAFLVQGNGAFLYPWGGGSLLGHNSIDERVGRILSTTPLIGTDMLSILARETLTELPRRPQ